jgi:hypothetical protein
VPRSRTAGLQGNTAPNLLKNYRTHPRQSHHFALRIAVGKDSNFSTLLLPPNYLFDDSHPNDRKLYLTVVLIYISLMTHDTEHLFM